MSKQVVALVVVVTVIGGLAGFILGMSTPSVVAGDYDDEIADELETLNSRLSTLNKRFKELNGSLGTLAHEIRRK